jgi:hypothetical protein
MQPSWGRLLIIGLVLWQCQLLSHGPGGFTSSPVRVTKPSAVIIYKQHPDAYKLYTPGQKAVIEDTVAGSVRSLYREHHGEIRVLDVGNMELSRDAAWVQQIAKRPRGELPYFFATNEHGAWYEGTLPALEPETIAIVTSQLGVK